MLKIPNQDYTAKFRELALDGKQIEGEILYTSAHSESLTLGETRIQLYE